MRVHPEGMEENSCKERVSVVKCCFVLCTSLLLGGVAHWSWPLFVVATVIAIILTIARVLLERAITSETKGENAHD